MNPACSRTWVSPFQKQVRQWRGTSNIGCREVVSGKASTQMGGKQIGERCVLVSLTSRGVCADEEVDLDQVKAPRGVQAVLLLMKCRN